MSNWFKKFFGLTGDDDNDQMQPVHKHTSNKKNTLYNKSKNEAKVVYDYPKGNFRFPVIPDENNGLPVSQNRKIEQAPTNFRQKNNQSSPKERVRKTPKRNVEHENDRYSEVNSSQSVSLTRKEFRNVQPKKVEPPAEKNNPFKPTEVPSPVYGFKKREKDSLQQRDSQQEPVALTFDQELSVNRVEDSGFEQVPTLVNFVTGKSNENKHDIKTDRNFQHDLSKDYEEKSDADVVKEEQFPEMLQPDAAQGLAIEKEPVLGIVHEEVVEEEPAVTVAQVKKVEAMPAEDVALEEVKEETPFENGVQEETEVQVLLESITLDEEFEETSIEGAVQVETPEEKSFENVAQEETEVQALRESPTLEKEIEETSIESAVQVETLEEEPLENVAQEETEVQALRESPTLEREIEEASIENAVQVETLEEEPLENVAQEETEVQVSQENITLEEELEEVSIESSTDQVETLAEGRIENIAQAEVLDVETKKDQETFVVEKLAVEYELKETSSVQGQSEQQSVSDTLKSNPIDEHTIFEQSLEIVDSERDLVAEKSKLGEIKMQLDESSENVHSAINQLYSEVAVSIETEEPQVEMLDVQNNDKNLADVDHQRHDSSQDETIVNVQSKETKGVQTLKKKDPLTWNGKVVPFNVMMFKQDKQKLSISTTSEPVKREPSTKPGLNLLDVPPTEIDDDQEWIQEQCELLNTAFESFNVGAKVVKATKGPAVTQFEVHPEHGVRVNKITNLSDDLKLALAAKDIRIEAPIPGKNTIGIEVPNRKSRPVLIREILRSPVFQQSNSPLVVALGLDISGQPVVTDLKKMPHGLIAGATGSGKSVCINSIIVSLLYKASPHEVKLLLVDPKMVELAPYNDIPHLVSPVITDVKAATAALKWAVEEMERRYELFAHEGVRDISRFNEKVLRENEKAETMPYLVIIIDELADLMMVSPADVEDAICRIAQKARACGIHLLLATQRPSVDVITGLIKANIPTRIAFSVSSQVDSRTIIDISGAEKLLGKGDMLLLENGSNKPVRVQGNFVSDDEIERVTKYVRSQSEPNYLFVQEELMKQTNDIVGEDELFIEACEFIIEQEGASASSIQRRFRVGYNRAARLIDMMEAQGIVSEAKGSKPRDVLITKEQFEKMQKGSF
ncbi:DNA translocase FtsK [Bacillus sp. Marseille-P3661]|uniref:DNA translocase FtsK n=1 Tax=Bacillus sp. Marseille-P3661 TaxID=1936234 RepID=UPI0027E41EFD|nr:DNA translocase FtsK [Bacillus sp. Marseille-P3661]